MGLKKIRKTHFVKELENQDGRVIFVNFQYENGYNHMIQKLIGLINVLPSSIQAIILGLPPNATYIDTHLAEILQKLLMYKHSASAVILFVKHEDKQKLLDNLYFGKGSTQRVKNILSISAEINPDSLLYSWGSSRYGKLGISENYFTELGEGENHS